MLFLMRFMPPIKAVLRVLCFLPCCIYAGPKKVSEAEKMAQLNSFFESFAISDSTAASGKKGFDKLGLNLFRHILKYLDRVDLLNFAQVNKKIKERILKADHAHFINNIRMDLAQKKRWFFWHESFYYSFYSLLKNSTALVNMLSANPLLSKIAHLTPFVCGISQFQAPKPDVFKMLQNIKPFIVTDDLRLFGDKELTEQIVAFYLQLVVKEEGKMIAVGKDPSCFPAQLSWILPIVQNNNIQISAKFPQDRRVLNHPFFVELFNTGCVCEAEMDLALFQKESLNLSSLLSLHLTIDALSDLRFSWGDRTPHLQLLKLQFSPQQSNEQASKYDVDPKKIADLGLDDLKEIFYPAIPKISDSLFQKLCEILPKGLKSLDFSAPSEHASTPVTLQNLSFLSQRFNNLIFVGVTPVLTKGISLTQYLTILAKHKNLSALRLNLDTDLICFEQKNEVYDHRSVGKSPLLFPCFEKLILNLKNVSVDKIEALTCAVQEILPLLGMTVAPQSPQAVKFSKSIRVICATEQLSKEASILVHQLMSKKNFSAKVLFDSRIEEELKKRLLNNTFYP